jgi:hypothetical protein
MLIVEIPICQKTINTFLLVGTTLALGQMPKKKLQTRRKTNLGQGELNGK